MFTLLFLRIWWLFHVKILKNSASFFYIYLGIIVMNSIINIIILIDIDLLSITTDTEVIYEKITLKIVQNKENSYLKVQTEQDTKIAIESNNKIDPVDVDNNKKDKCIGKNPLKDIHKYLLSADKSYYPSHFQKNALPNIPEDVPVYGNKLVTFKPLSLLQNRNLPKMFIEIPKGTNMGGKLTELGKAIEGADEAIKLYDSQYVKFNKVLSGIQNGTEEFYPNEAKPLMETYIDLVAKLSNQQKVMANEAIKQLHKLDHNFSRDLYPVENSSKDTGGTAGEASGATSSGSITDTVLGMETGSNYSISKNN
ncbi:hypothetical protein MFIFM68171_m1 (mitochondrion) [Madurella fahalii]|uniref:Uncharacterized protein n=1 Tax=Madurella fahalii TaxID=1157608 RepID=A0ABN7CJT9_9PEZI